MRKDRIVAATDEALRQMGERRFFRTERGFHGRFYCALQRVLDEKGLLRSGSILEMEYQKSERHHGMRQRPDIVLHVPAEESGAGVAAHNVAVWALKRRATGQAARDDFRKLDEMFDRLCYSLGIFLNIDANDHFATSYEGRFPDRLRTVTARFEGGAVVTSWGCPEKACEKGT